MNAAPPPVRQARSRTPTDKESPCQPFPASTILGYPRIGRRRELKRALEAYWDGRSTREDLDAVGSAAARAAWRRLADHGLGGIPSNTFSNYDQVLDSAVCSARSAATLPRPAGPVLRDGPRRAGHRAAADDEVVQHELPLHRPGDRAGHRVPPRRVEAAGRDRAGPADRRRDASRVRRAGDRSSCCRTPPPGPAARRARRVRAAARLLAAEASLGAARRAGAGHGPHRRRTRRRPRRLRPARRSGGPSRDPRRQLLR
jgi:hypothetical protein